MGNLVIREYQALSLGPIYIQKVQSQSSSQIERVPVTDQAAVVVSAMSNPSKVSESWTYSSSPFPFFYRRDNQQDRTSRRVESMTRNESVVVSSWSRRRMGARVKSHPYLYLRSLPEY